MKTLVEFKSSSFPKYKHEDDELVNATRWGKRLAEFVRDNIPNYGVETENILCEDWGWLVYTNNEAFPLWIGCGVVDGIADFEGAATPRTSSASDHLKDYQPEDTLFCMFVEAEPSWFQRLFGKIDTERPISIVANAIKKNGF